MFSAKFRLKINYKISILGIHEIRSVTLCLLNGTAFSRTIFATISITQLCSASWYLSLFLFLSHLSIETISIGGIVRAAQGENRRLSRQIFDFVYSIFQKNDAAAISTPALSAKYYRWNSNVDMRGARRKRISSISQRVAVTVSVMAFGSVVESYSCANPIRALLRVYFRTRVARVYIVVVIVSCTHAFTERQRQTGRLRTFYRIIHRSDSLMYPKKLSYRINNLKEKNLMQKPR